MILFLDGRSVLSEDKGVFWEQTRKQIGEEEKVVIEIGHHMEWNRVYRYLEDAHAIVLVADVQFGNISSKVLTFLERVESIVIRGESIGGKFYAILYTKLYEVDQTAIAMGILKNFCARANIVWGRGLGISGNGLKMISPDNYIWNIFRRKKTDFRTKALQEQALFIREKIEGTDVYIWPESTSKRMYVRKFNRKIKKSNREKIAQSRMNRENY